MADGQGMFGGGGSVHWQIDVNDGDVPEIKGKGKPRAYVISGVDKHGKNSDPTPDYFVISIQPPKAGGAVRVVPDGRGVVVYVAVDPERTSQMLVEWAFKEADIPAEAVDIVELAKKGAGV